MNKTTFSERLKKILRIKNVKQVDLCAITKIPKSAMSQYANGYCEPKQDRVELIAKALDVSEAWLMGFDVPMDRSQKQSDATSGKSIYEYENVIPMPTMKQVPLVGTIACGTPILAVENIEQQVNIPENIHADFALRCEGNSMIDAHIYNGDIVYIRQQPIVDNGEIAAVLIGNEATLKRFYQRSNTVTLMPCNPSYEPFVYSGQQLEEIRIIGKAVGFTSTNI